MKDNIQNLEIFEKIDYNFKRKKRQIMANIFDFNPHEYLSCILYNDLYRFHPLNEIRGRIPFIEKILPEIERQLLSKCNWNNVTNVISLEYKPSITTFFNNIHFKNVSITITSELNAANDITEGSFDNTSIIWTDEKEPKVESLDIYCIIKCPSSRLSYNIQRTIGHELLHAYEAYQRHLLNKPFDNSNSTEFYKIIQILRQKGNAPQSLFANLFYLNNPHELNAYSQGIQSGYNAIAWQFSVNFQEFPFAMLKKHITEFQTLERLKSDIKWLYENFSESDLIAAMNTILDNPIKTINQLNKIVSYQIINIEQTYNKALSRAVENRAINDIYMDSGPKDYFTEKAIKKQLNEIYETFGYPPNLKRKID